MEQGKGVEKYGKTKVEVSKLFEQLDEKSFFERIKKIIPLAKYENVAFFFHNCVKDDKSLKVFLNACRSIKSINFAYVLTHAEIKNLEYFFKQITLPDGDAIDFIPKCLNEEFAYILGGGHREVFNFFFKKFNNVEAYIFEYRFFENELFSKLRVANLDVIKRLYDEFLASPTYEAKKDFYHFLAFLKQLNTWSFIKEDYFADMYSHKKELGNNPKEKLTEIIGNIFSRLERDENLDSKFYRPKHNPNTSKNAVIVNQSQDEKLVEDGINMKTIPDNASRTLVLYVRQQHGNLNSKKAAAYARLLYEYINVEKRSPVFTNFIIVNDWNGFSVDLIPTMRKYGVPIDELFRKVRGEEYIHLNIHGNVVYASHARAKDSEEFHSICITSQSVMQNEEKMPEGRGGFIPLHTSHDMLDTGSPQRLFDYSEKDRSGSVKRMLQAMMWSVLNLENRMLSEAFPKP